MGNPYFGPNPYAGSTPAQNPGYGGHAPTIGGQVDPQSAALVQAMKSMGQQPQGNATGLGSNLLADALMQYTLKQRQQMANLSPTQMNVGPIQLGGNGLMQSPDLSSGLPDVSYG